MQLLGERILVKKIEKESPIILPDKVMVDEIIEGEVVALGNRIPNETGCDELEIGDIVQWSAYAGTWTKIEGAVVCVLRPNDIVCKLSKKPELNSVLN